MDAIHFMSDVVGRYWFVWLGIFCLCVYCLWTMAGRDSRIYHFFVPLVGTLFMVFGVLLGLAILCKVVDIHDSSPQQVAERADKQAQQEGFQCGERTEQLIRNLQVNSEHYGELLPWSWTCEKSGRTYSVDSPPPPTIYMHQR